MFEFYDINSPRIRERYCGRLYKMLVIVYFIVLVVLPSLASIIVPIVTGISELLLLLLLLPLYFFLFKILKMSLAVSYGAYIDLLNINSKIKKQDDSKAGESK